MLLQLNLHFRLNTWLQWIGQRQLQDETRNINVLGLGATYIKGSTVCASDIYHDCLAHAKDITMTSLEHHGVSNH